MNLYELVDNQRAFNLLEKLLEEELVDSTEFVEDKLIICFDNKEETKIKILAEGGKLRFFNITEGEFRP